MFNFLQYFELSSLQQWLNFIFIGLILSTIIIACVSKFYKFIKKQIQAHKIVKFLITNNHSARNALIGKHLADRLLDIYNNGKPIPLVSRDEVYKRENFWKSTWSENVIDKILQGKGLVKIFERDGRRQVKLSENSLTNVVIKFLVKMVNENQI